MEADWERAIRKATGEPVENSVLEVREHDIKRQIKEDEFFKLSI